MSKVNYDTLITVGKKVSSLKDKYEDLKVDTTSLKKILEETKIPTEEELIEYCKKNDNFNIFMVPDVRHILGDKNYHFKMDFSNGRYEIKDTVEALGDSWNMKKVYDDSGNLVGISYGTDNFAPKIKYRIPSIDEWNSRTTGEYHKVWIPFHYLEGSYETNVKSVLNTWKEILNDVISYFDKFNTGIDEIIAQIDVETNNIDNIYDAYKNLEKAAEENFKGPKGKAYNKKRIATTYAALVTSAGSKAAEQYLKKALKDAKKKTNSKITSSDVINVYEEWKKKDGNISGNLYSKKPNSNTNEKEDDNSNQKPNDSSSNGGHANTTAIATGAHVVSSTPSKKKKSKKKNKKKSSSSNILIGATALAATRKGIKAEIKQIKADAKIQISNAQIVAGDKKKNIEIEKNEKIAEVNQKAKEAIDAINPEDEDAQEKIEEIKQNAEKEVKEINEEYNQDIAKIDEDLNKEIEKIKSDRDTTVRDLNKELDNLKSDKKANAIVEQKLESGAKATTTAATAATVSQSDVTDSNEKMMNATGELSDTYEEKSAAIQEYVSNSESNNTSSSDTSSETTPVSTPTNTSDTNTNVAEESVASPTSTQSSSENTSSEPTYTSSNYSSEDNYVTNDGMREDVVEPVTEATTETSTDTGVDQSNVKPIPKTDSTTSTTTGKDTDDTISIAGSDDTDSKKGSSGSGLGTVIPVGLGIAATGAAAVAGVRYVKNRKQNEDMDETYDDENNDLDDSSSEYENIPSDSAYMKDDYLGPEGSTYTEVPDENSYTDAEELEEAAGINDFSEDAALNDLN